jgi:hypothetical protein
MKRSVCVVGALVLAALAVPGSLRGAGKPAPGPGKPAMVRVPKGDVAVELTFEDGGRLVVTSKGSPLSAGTHWVKSLSMFKKDKGGRRWELRGVGNLGNAQVVIVDEGQDKVLDMGTPVGFYAGANQDAGKLENLNIQFSLSGRYGEGYLPEAFVDGVRQSPAAFRILTADGKTAFADRFAPATGNTASYVWKMPRGLSGKFKLELKPDIGPFEWSTNAGEFEVKTVP